MLPSQYQESIASCGTAANGGDNEEERKWILVDSSLSLPANQKYMTATFQICGGHLHTHLKIPSSKRPSRLFTWMQNIVKPKVIFSLSKRRLWRHPGYIHTPPPLTRSHQGHCIGTLKFKNNKIKKGSFGYETANRPTPALCAFHLATGLSGIWRSKSILNCGTLFHCRWGWLHEHLQKSVNPSIAALCQNWERLRGIFEIISFFNRETVSSALIMQPLQVGLWILEKDRWQACPCTLKLRLYWISIGSIAYWWDVLFLQQSSSCTCICLSPVPQHVHRVRFTMPPWRPGWKLEEIFDSTVPPVV